MSGRDHHRQQGAKIGYEEYVAWKRRRGEEPSLVESFFWSWVGSVAANLADDLEPPTGPKHRSYLHSWEALALATSKYNSQEDLFSKVVLRAYASHLRDDSRTTASLPIAAIKFLRALQ